MHERKTESIFMDKGFTYFHYTHEIKREHKENTYRYNYSITRYCSPEIMKNGHVLNIMCVGESTEQLPIFVKITPFPIEL